MEHTKMLSTPILKRSRLGKTENTQTEMKCFRYGNVTTVDSQSKSTFDTEWAYNTSIALSSVFKDYPELDSNEVLVYEKSYVEDVVTTEGIHTSEAHHQVIIHAETIAKASDGSRIRDTRSWILSAVEGAFYGRARTRVASRWLNGPSHFVMRRSKTTIWDPSSWKTWLQLRFSDNCFTRSCPEHPPSATPNADGTLPRNIPTARMGRRLLPFGWSVVDDATMDPQLNGSYAYDAQGVSPKRVELVEDGVVKDLLMTRIPRGEFTESTGHARASGGDRYVAFPSVVTVKPKRHTKSASCLRKAFSSPSKLETTTSWSSNT